ncbi:MAG: N-acetyltransferase [Sphingobacteriales bacterium]|nr:MAG: N-acetyltransferase [Sphingobacteriales bacterium]
MHVTPSIQLEPLDNKHAAPFFRIVEESRAYLREWLPWVDFMLSADHFDLFIQGAKRRTEQKMEVSYAIVFEGEVVGRIGLFYIHEHNKIASIGYWIGQQYQGKGIITASCKKLITYGFNILGLNRIEIKCGVGNSKSTAIPERLGFTREGIIRQGELVNNEFIDLYLYSVLKEEWEG